MPIGYYRLSCPHLAIAKKLSNFNSFNSMSQHSTTHPAAFNSYSHGVAHPKGGEAPGHELAAPPAGGDVATFTGGGLGSNLMAPGVFQTLSKAMPYLCADIYEADAGLFYDIQIPGCKKENVGLFVETVRLK